MPLPETLKVVATLIDKLGLEKANQKLVSISQTRFENWVVILISTQVIYLRQ